MSIESASDGIRAPEYAPQETFGGMDRSRALALIEAADGRHVRSIVEQYLSGSSASLIASEYNVYPSFVEDVVNHARQEIKRKLVFDKKRSEFNESTAAIRPRHKS